MASQGELVKQTVLDHYPPAVQQLFRGLENQLQRAGKLAGARQIFSGVEQRGGVPVMAAAVKAPFNLACPRLTAPLLHRQGIHIRPQAKAFSPRRRAACPPLRCPPGRGEPRIPHSPSSRATSLLVWCSSKPISGCWWNRRRRAINCASLTCNASSNGCVIFVIPVLCLHDTFEFMRVPQLAGALFCFILTKNQ